MNFLLSFDRTVFLWINTKATTPWLDRFFPIFTDLHKLFWVKDVLLPLFLIWFLWKFRLKAVRALVAVALAVGLSDMFCYRVLKKVVERPRPFASLELRGRVHKLAPATGSSFPSNHAANCFAGAGVLSYFFPPAAPYLYAYAALTAYSRVYVGVHYPSDVLAGILIGLGFAALIRLFFRKN